MIMLLMFVLKFRGQEICHDKKQAFRYEIHLVYLETIPFKDKKELKKY